MELEELLRQGKIPQIGLGPGAVSSNKIKNDNPLSFFIWRVYNKFVDGPRRKKHFVNAVVDALKMGYRLIDYSASYGDGSLLGEVIKKSGINREEIFITTRISNKAQMNHKVREQFMSFIKNLGVDYVDLLQFHWPVTGLYLDTWREMEKLKDEGLVKHLGVANCHQHHLEEIFKICKHRPEVGQFEIHPLFTQKPLIQYYKDNGIVVESYTPIARYDDRLVRLPLLKRLEKKYSKTFVQIILRWHVQNGVIPLVRSLSYKHQQENFDIFNFELDEDDMKAIDSININSRLRYDPDNCDFSIL